MLHEHQLKLAALAIQNSDALLFAAGAGMGVDSGLPDFRGQEGFWRAYPPFAKLGLSFEEVADPVWFVNDPALAWGFYGHRFNLYRQTTPHAGYAILREWANQKPHFVFTSNVDGAFQKSGFEPVCEVHGSIFHWQCRQYCTTEIWDAPDKPLEIDESTFRARDPLPRCPKCDELARPNILMFGDYSFNPRRTGAQKAGLLAWLQKQDASQMTVIECGAGKSVPTVRRFCEQFLVRGATLIRINVRDSDCPKNTISIPLGAREALENIDAILRQT